MAAPSDTAVDYERTDASPRLLGWLAAGIAAVLVVSPLVLMLAFPAALQARVITDNLSQVPPPRLQTNPKRDFSVVRAAEDKVLSGYAWIDRSRGTVRIPIQRAVDLTVARGLPGWP